MNRSIVAVAAAVCVAVSMPVAGGVPTIAVATDLQLQMQFQQMLKDYQVLKEQYATLRQHYAAVTGSSGIGSVGLDRAIGAANVVPGSWQDVVAQQANGGYGDAQRRYETLLNTLPPELFVDPKAQDATTYRLGADAVRAAMAGGDQLYGAVQQHLLNLIQHAQAIDTDETLKQSTDRNSRLVAEQALLQTEMARLAAMNTNLQANAMNQQLQAEAATRRYFQRPTAAGASSH